jgi:glycosyltransferase involved in cell wall biosynthesis
MDVSLIITTYNWPEALELTLASVLRQTRLPDEVIIADDGSKEETAQTIRKVLEPTGLKWFHVWQNDLSVRQSRIKNLAVKYSHYPYLIFIDQDVVLHPDFVADHLSMARPGFFLQGKRVILPQAYTKKLIAEGTFRIPSLFLFGLGNRKNTIRFPGLGCVLSGPKKFEASLRGCNLSLYKNDYLAVDGFDEVFDQSWGREDSDICYRLFHAGVRVKNLWFMALQYHLYHNTFTKWDKERLDEELERNLTERRIRAVRGFSKLSEEGQIKGSSPGF